MGRRGRGRRRRSGSAGSTLAEPSRPLVAEHRGAARASWPPRASTTSCSPAWAARRSRPRSSRAPPACRADRARHAPTRTRCARALTATGSTATVLVVSSASPARTVETDSQRRALRAGVPRRRHRPGRADRRRHRPRLAAGDVGRGEPATASCPRRPARRRPLLGADRVRPGAQRPGRRRRRRAARRGRRGRRLERATTSDNPALALGAALGGDATRGRDKVVLVDRRLGHHRLRRLGRAAHRRVDRQGRHAASCRSWSRAPTRPRSLRRTTSRRPAGRPPRRRGRHDVPRPRAATTARSRQRLARRAVPGLGVRRRRRRPAARHQPVRPAGRRESPRRPPAACSTRRPAADRRPTFVDGGVEVRATPGLLGGASTVDDAVDALLGTVGAADGYLAVMAYLDRRATPPWPQVRGAARRRLRPARRPSAGGRGSCTRPGSTTRAAPRPASSCRSRPSSPQDLDGPGPAVHVRTAASRRRPPATPQVLADHGRPVLRLHLRDRAAGCGGSSASSARRRPERSAIRDCDEHLADAVAQSAAGPERTGGCPASPGRAALVIFGVTGDLSRKKLMPAIYDLANRGLLPPGFALVGFARRDWATEDFAPGRPRRGPRARAHRRSARRCGSSSPRASGSCPGDFDDDDAFDALAADRRRARPGPRHRRQPRLLPVDPAEGLPASCSSSCSDPGWPTARGRPAGAGSWSRSRSATTCKSARELNDVVDDGLPAGLDLPDRPLPGQGDGPEHPGAALRERRCSSRSGTRNYVDHVQITMAEDIGIGGRAGYYDGIGAARDVIQNHLLQLLALTAMEEPISFDAEDLRAEKEKVLAAVTPARATCDRARRRGQYAGGWQGGEQVRGLPRGGGHPAGLDDRDLRGGPPRHREPALGRGAVLPAHRQAARPPGDRDRGGVQARPAPARSTRPTTEELGHNARHPGAAGRGRHHPVRLQGARHRRWRSAT